MGLGIAAAIAIPALMSARPTVVEEARPAPNFTLNDTNGNAVELSSFRGQPVLLYFNEGAGCESCIYQMVAIEEYAAFDEDGIVVLPVVMDRPDAIQSAMAAFNVTTPFLLDDGTVSNEYGALGTGMHADLPGHGFVLIDAAGSQVWAGNYPSMWLAPEDLFAEVSSRL